MWALGGSGGGFVRRNGLGLLLRLLLRLVSEGALQEVVEVYFGRKFSKLLLFGSNEFWGVYDSLGLRASGLYLMEALGLG